MKKLQHYTDMTMAMLAIAYMKQRNGTHDCGDGGITSHERMGNDDCTCLGCETATPLVMSEDEHPSYDEKFSTEWL